MDQRSWFNQLYRNEPSGPMIPNNAPPMPMDMGGGGMVGYEPQQVQDPIGAFDDPIRLGMAQMRKSQIKPTEYVASETKPDVLEHAKVEDDTKSLLDSHIKSLADHANAGMSVSTDNNRIGSIEDMYGLNVYRPKSTGEKVMDFIGGFAPTVIAGLGSMADPDNGAYGIGSTDAALKQLSFYQNQAQNDKNKALDIRAGLLKDDDLLGAYGKTVNAYQSPNPPSMEVDRYLMQQLMQNQAMKKTPADFQPYLLSTYDEATGSYYMPKALDAWNKERLLRMQMDQAYKNALLGLRERSVENQENKLYQLPSGQVDKLSEVTYGISALDDLIPSIAKQTASMGPVGGLKKFNPYDPESNLLNSMYKNVTQVIGKAKEGGVLREHDENKYLDMLGSVRKDPKTAEAVLKYISKDLKNRYNIKLKAFSDTKYDIGNLSPYETEKSELDLLKEALAKKRASK